MQIERRLTAMQVAGTACAGSLLLYLSVWATYLPLPFAEPRDAGFLHLLWSARLELCCTLLPGLVGALLMYRGMSVFQRALRLETWPEAAVDAVQERLRRTHWIGFTTGLAVAGLGYAVYLLCAHTGTHAHRGGSFPYFFVAPLICAANLKRVTPLKREPFDWNSMKPFVSEHWGGRGARCDQDLHKA